MKKQRKKCDKCGVLCHVDEKGYLMDSKGNDNFLGCLVFEFHKCKEVNQEYAEDDKHTSWRPED